MARGLGAARHRLRRLHPDHRAAAPAAVVRSSSTPSTTTAATTSTWGTYEGLYCVSCEAYYTEDELLERASARSTSGRSSAMARRTTSSGSPRTRTGCSSTTSSIPRRSSPRSGATRCCRLIRGGLQDFSISRTTFDWGIPLPWDPKHVCYVWFDALTNYITAAGYADDPERFARMWPANIHSIGKDILRFHADLLAGDADGRRRRAADAGVGPRLPHGRRQEDVEDERSPASTRSS